MTHFLAACLPDTNFPTTQELWQELGQQVRLTAGGQPGLARSSSRASMQRPRAKGSLSGPPCPAACTLC